MEFGPGPKARTEGYSIRGSHAKRVALNCGGTLIGGNRFSVSGPVRTASWAARDATKSSVTTRKSGAVTFPESRDAKCFTLIAIMNDPRRSLARTYANNTPVVPAAHFLQHLRIGGIWAWSKDRSLRARRQRNLLQFRRTAHPGYFGVILW